MVRRVEDANEIYFHMLECIQVHLFNTVGLPEKSTQSNRDTMNTSTLDNGYNFSSSASTSNATYNASSSNFSNVQRVKDDIVEVAKTVVMNGNRRTGVTKADILAPLYEAYNEDDLEQAFGLLVNDGILFNTLDEEHFTINF
ncbi:predicted protein [Naegleria gruberi]|uniref:Predicted protein n=1 Tax=Naegleria gruberi TaxID=5762 RepID=D2VJJ4_NAEGR|nr:uncharacterized protein NAEGRDRAFT_50066 [Naegleria gruberi]EFC43048.1 predicted protein [Naegleria gruberi]|eukprot:XP_002675792.1 predicted protein [Naegleria gruberi strain NEG-M]